MDLAGDILQLRINLEVSLDNILSLIELNKNVIDIANNKLSNLRTKLLGLKIGGGIVRDIDNTVSFLDNLNSNPQIRAQKDTIREQVIVLFIGSLEIYLSDVIKTIGNDQPELFKFKNDTEKISFTQDMLRSGFKLGDAILEHIIVNKSYSFQDLKSSLEVFKDYLSIDIVLDDESVEALILCGASRNIIVHNLSIINRKFLHQIRSTSFADQYKLDDPLKVTDKLISDSREAIFEYADQVTAALVEYKD